MITATSKLLPEKSTRWSLKSVGQGAYIKLLLILCVYSTVLLWLRVGWPLGSLFFERKNEKNTSLPFLIDFNCLQALNEHRLCDGPVRVATIWDDDESYEKNNSDYFETTYQIGRLNDVDYLMFVPLNRKNATFVQRAVPTSDRFKLRVVNFTDGRSFHLHVPLEIDSFLRHWQNGYFRDCLGLDMKRKARKQTISLSEAKVQFANFRKTIDRKNATVFILAGTLLGWYRECTVISHTTDSDFGLLSTELTSEIVKRIETKYTMIHKLGLPSDSLELTFMLGNIRADLFVVYSLNETNSYTTVVSFKERKTLMAIYPRLTNLCTGDLLGILVYVPCNVEEVLQTDYGPNWRTDRPSSNYSYLQAPNVISFLEHSKKEFAKRVVTYGNK
ncbi:hypothetical protein M3Y98_00086300 [Aphelenchoides besseyi]|nr:hypothetical protein M3Y98_00086300 [Aphelenchoides besseyi]KAI6198462.1 hypothetical protein M3Y96_00521800 [Aphelenchoides besseyi]